jgi:hypothetical protein
MQQGPGTRYAALNRYARAGEGGEVTRTADEKGGLAGFGLSIADTLVRLYLEDLPTEAVQELVKLKS